MENTTPGHVTIQLCESASPDGSPTALREEAPMFAFARAGSSPFDFEQIHERVHQHLASLHLDTQVGFGTTPDLAWLAACARDDHQNDADSFHVVNSAGDLASASLDAFALPPAMSGILHRWGIRTIGGFLALGRDDLVRRLGAEAGDYFDRATGRGRTLVERGRLDAVPR